MRLTLPITCLAITLTTACGQGDRAFTNPLTGLQNVITTPDKQRGAVELAVKGNFPMLIANIEAGGGTALTAAFDAAGVPQADRPTRTFQLRQEADLYATNPSALISALLIYGGATA